MSIDPADLHDAGPRGVTGPGPTPAELRLKLAAKVFTQAADAVEALEGPRQGPENDRRNGAFRTAGAELIAAAIAYAKEQQ